MASSCPARAQSVQTLEHALTDISATLARKRVPVLVLDAAHVKPEKNAPAVNGGSDPLGVVAAKYGRKEVRFDSLSVLAPVQMAHIAAPPNPPRSHATNTSERLAQLLASLEPAQWAAITGADGLAITDLNPAQQSLVGQMTPDTMRIWKSGGDDESARTLTAEERAGLRLRLSRDTELTIPGTTSRGKTGNYGFANIAVDASLVNPNASVFLSEDGQNADTVKANSRPDEPPPYRTWLLNRFKPGDLDLSETSPAAATLAKPVSLAGAATLGDLIKRAASISGWELYADPRVARLPVHAYIAETPTVRLGDLLRALCWAVTGTFRRVGPSASEAAYTLTDDREGIGTRIARIEEWDRLADLLADQTDEKAVAKVREGKHGGAIGYAPDDPFALPLPLVQSLIKDRLVRRAGLTEGAHNPPFASLSPALQNLLRAHQKNFADAKDPITLDIQKATLEPTIGLSLLLPGKGGKILLNPLDPSENIAEALAPPMEEAAPAASTAAPALSPDRWLKLKPDGKPFVLRIKAATPEEGADAVRLALRYGFARLYIDAPEGEPGKATIAAAIAEAGKQLPVWRVVSALKPRGIAADDDSRDHNILGEASEAYARRRASGADFSSDRGFAFGALKNLLAPPGDFLRFDRPADDTARIHRIHEAADIPGLAGIALTDTAPPGSIPLVSDVLDDWQVGLGDSGDFGYSPEMRLAFLRKTGYDPIDLCTGGFLIERIPGKETQLPFFPREPLRRGRFPDYYAESGRSFIALPVIQWQIFRQERLARFETDLYTDLHTAFPDLGLMMAEQFGHALDGSVFWGSWDIADKPPMDHEKRLQDGSRLPDDPHGVSKFVLRPLRVSADAPHAEWAGILAQYTPGSWLDRIEGRVPTDGVLIDLSTMNAARARAFVEGTLAPAAR